VHAVEAGVVRREAVTELGTVQTRQAESRQAEDEITVFDWAGLAIQDLAVALAALQRASELDVPQLNL
jgi:ornithine cyclodeaminase/alanine dehydrogenase-like protein (mu-crystallin family)